MGETPTFGLTAGKQRGNLVLGGHYSGSNPVGRWTFLEFFAGAGMARAGLGKNWQCLLANEFDSKKAQTYRKNWGSPDVLIECDVRKLTTDQVDVGADLAWASFPCQDLSLAGAGAGLRGERSGTFWPFWRLIESLTERKGAPKLVILENVGGTLTSHGGKDFAAICGALDGSNYRFGALVIDAAYFVPQSRPRLFFVGVRGDVEIPSALLQQMPSASPWFPRALVNAQGRLSKTQSRNWVWWCLPRPRKRTLTFADLVEMNPRDVAWHSKSETTKLLEMMSEANQSKLTIVREQKTRVIGTIYRRTRKDEFGRKLQRAEVRFDDIAGCLRTPAGGSSRQIIIEVCGNSTRTRLISSRETARLMGLPDNYVLPDKYNEAYHLTGDGIAVPVVRHLAANLCEPLLINNISRLRAAE